jgi:DNA repair protein RecO (recombination protein O)
MLFKTKGIVLNQIKYRETSIITKIYTEDFGLKSYIVNGIRSNSSKTKIGLFQPLTLLDLVVYDNEKTTLHRISEIKCYAPYKSIPFEIKKSSIILFLSEILNKTLKEENSNKELFHFLSNSLIYFDEIPENYQNFHLQFLFQLSAFLGFSPSNLDDIVANEKSLISEREKIYLEKLMICKYNEVLNTNNEIRRNSLKYILRFFRLHIENFGELNSEKILKEVLN